MIQIRDLNKTFQTQESTVRACENINLDVRAGEIFGIIGTSGAGKSTLVRCINLMERPETGSVRVDGTELTALPEKELRKHRKRIGMIFQLFNLMNSRTVYGNVAYPLKSSGLSKSAQTQKIRELL
jgi:D-methionine transport system ATP-binding protein